MDFIAINNYVVSHLIHFTYLTIILFLIFILFLKIYYDSFGINKLKRQLKKCRNPFKKKVKKEIEITLKEVEEIEYNINEMKNTFENILKSINYSYGLKPNKKIKVIDKLLKVDKMISEFEDYVKIYHKQLLEYITINERPPLEANVIKTKEYKDEIKVENKPYDNSHRGLKKEGFKNE